MNCILDGIDKVLNYSRGFGFRDHENFDIAGNCRQMLPMQLQLRLQWGFRDSENFDVAAAIAVVDRNLKPWELL